MAFPWRGEPERSEFVHDTIVQVMVNDSTTALVGTFRATEARAARASGPSAFPQRVLMVGASTSDRLAWDARQISKTVSARLSCHASRPSVERRASQSTNVDEGEACLSSKPTTLQCHTNTSLLLTS